MSNISDIKNYILFLKSRCGLMITLHPYAKENLITSSELISFNIHESPYCIYVKSHPAAQKHCIERQCKVFDRCKDGSFCGRCYAGVTEYVYPISNGHEAVGFISVSGYRSEGADSFIFRCAEKYSIDRAALSKLYSSLSDTLPKKEEVDTLIMPLCNMLELAYIKSEDSAAAEESFVSRVLAYIKRNHTADITLDEVCRHFSCSHSHLSHTFKKSVGTSFREYLTHLRIEDAKALLSYSRLSVTEIALSVGFSDSNYFSSVFKKSVGKSPLAYRRIKNT